MQSNKVILVIDISNTSYYRSNIIAAESIQLYHRSLDIPLIMVIFT